MGELRGVDENHTFTKATKVRDSQDIQGDWRSRNPRKNSHRDRE